MKCQISRKYRNTKNKSDEIWDHIKEFIYVPIVILNLESTQPMEQRE